MASYLDIKNTILERISKTSNPEEKKELYIKLYRLNEAYNLFDQALDSFGKEIEPDAWEDAHANKGSDMSGNEDDGEGVDNAYGGDNAVSGEGGGNQNFDEESEDFAIYIPDEIKKQAQPGFTYKNPQGISYQKQRNGRWKKVADQAIAQKKPGKLKKGTKTEKLGENEFIKVEKPTKALLTKLEKRGKDKPFRSWNTTSGYLFYYDPETKSWYKSTNTFSQKADALKAFESIQAPKKEEDGGYQPPVPIGTPLGSQEPEEQTPSKEEEKTPPPPKEEKAPPAEEKAPPTEEETPQPEPEKKPKGKAKAPAGNKPIVLAKHDVNFVKYGLMKLTDAPEDVQDWFNTHEAIASNLFVDKDGTFWMYEHGTLRRSDVPLDEKKIKAYHRLQETAAQFAKSDRYQQFIDGYLSEDIDKTMSLITDEEAIAINYLSGGSDSFKYGLKAQGRRIGKNYTGAGYTYINSFLRKRLDKIYVPTGDKKAFNQFLIRQAAKVRVFNQYLDSQEKDTSKLIRGKSLNADSFELAKDMFKVGEVIYDPGYSSASRKKAVATGFASKKTHRLYIEFDSDHGGVDIKKISQYGTEDETLIPQSAKFEIYDVTTTDTKMVVKVRRVKGEQQEGTKIPFSEEI